MNYLAQPLALHLELCPNPAGIYLRWLTGRSTWEGWLFDGASDPKTDVAEATDLTTADSRTQVAVRRAGQDGLLVRAGNLTTAQHAALCSILDSPQVYQQLPGGRLIPVLIAGNASAPRSSGDTRHVFELEVKLPPRQALTH